MVDSGVVGVFFFGSPFSPAEKQKLNCLMMLHFAFICVPMLFYVSVSAI